MNDKLLQNEPTTLPQPDRIEKVLLWFFWGVFGFFLFLYATLPIQDPDFWWHLKTGEVMAQDGALLSSDPFAFTGDGVVSARETLILKGYWLWQLTAYSLYALLDLNGVFLLNLFTALAMAGVVAQQLRRNRVGYALAMGLMALGFYLMSATYFLERPQVVSFLLAAILLALLARLRDGGELGWPLPLLMLVWSNLHGGFVVGDIILVCFAAGAVLEYRQDLPRLRPLLLWIAVGLGASLLNPTGGLAFAELFNFHNSALMTGVNEYQSTWVKFQHGSWYVVILWLLIALYGFGVWISRRLYWPDLLVALFLAGFSVAYLRNIGFFAVAMLPAIGFYWQQGMTLRGWHLPRGFKYLLVLIAAFFLSWQSSELWQRRSKEGSVSTFYPVELTRFILSSGIQGRMFNDYDFGGYFLWKLYPQHRVFIDGRGLDAQVHRDWMRISGASFQEEGGRKEYEVLLDRYAIDYVVQPLIHVNNARLTVLLKFLSIKPEWVPVYVDRQSYILVRNSRTNAAVIERYRLDKGYFYNAVIGYLTADCKRFPARVVNHVALAEVLIFVGRHAEAEERLAMIERLEPDNPHLSALRHQLDVLRK